METEVDVQTVLSCCFAISSSCSHSAVLWSGRDRSILASAALALHIALTFSFGSPPNAGGVNSAGNTANNTNARFIRTSHAMKLGQENPMWVYHGSRSLKKSGSKTEAPEYCLCQSWRCVCARCLDFQSSIIVPSSTRTRSRTLDQTRVSA